MICASLPTLGPLFRLVRDKFRALSGSSIGSRITSQVRRSSTSHRELSSTSGKWDKLHVLGHQLDDEERTSSHAGESIDDIPLVYHGVDQIHKTLKFKVTTSAKGDRLVQPINDRYT
jgi:hypothetical protein